VSDLFIYRTPGKIIQAAGAITDLPSTVGELMGINIFVVTDTTLLSLGLFSSLFESLKEAGYELTIFSEVEPEPSSDTVNKAVKMAQEVNAQTIIGAGGGSVMDVAKLVALLAMTPQKIEATYGADRCIGKRLPLVQIPTTAGTGSEVTWAAVVTTDSSEKKPIVSPLLIADAVILDPNLTLNLPPRITAATAVDAMVHAIEAFTSGSRKNAFADGLALQALSLLWENLPIVMDNGHALDARSAMLLGAMQAGMAFANATVGGVHALAYPVGALFHVPHGESNAMMLVPVMSFNRTTCQADYASIARHLKISQSVCDIEACDSLIKALADMINHLCLPDRLSQVGIEASDIELLVNDALNQTRLLSFNPRLLERDDIRRIYQSVLAD
jgi:alcohol dehydrogenase class IV